MRCFAITAAVVLLLAVPNLSGGTTPSIASAELVAELPHFLVALQHPALADSTDMRQYVVANVTLGGSEESFATCAAKLHSDSIAAELLTAYREANSSKRRFDASAAPGIRVVALDEFVTGPVTYDWRQLNAAYPNVKAVLRLSQPAIVGGDALVRLEMIGEGGTLWQSYVELKRDGAGRWRYARSIAGNLWN